MSFFEVLAPDPEPEEPEQTPPVWSGPPDGVLPVFSTQRALLARTDRLLLAVDRFLVYPNGIVFSLMLLRREDFDDHGQVPWEVFNRRKAAELSDDFMRFGLLFSDGMRWTNLRDRFPHHDEEVEGPVVIGQGGGGGGKRWEMSYWVWPLPASGKLTFVVSWPAEGIEEQRVEVDADEFHQLALQAEQVWTEQ